MESDSQDDKKEKRTAYNAKESQVLPPGKSKIKSLGDTLLPSDIEIALQKPSLEHKKAEKEQKRKARDKNMPFVPMFFSKKLIVSSPALSTPSSVSLQDSRDDHEPLRKSDENYSFQLFEESRVRKAARERKIQAVGQQQDKLGQNSEGELGSISEDPREREEYFKRRLFAEYGTTSTTRGRDMIPRERSPISVPVSSRKKSAKHSAKQSAKQSAKSSRKAEAKARGEASRATASSSSLADSSASLPEKHGASWDRTNKVDAWDDSSSSSSSR